MQPHQQRVVDEKTELDDKKSKLATFIESSALYRGLLKDEQERLSRQIEIMHEYS